MHTWHGRAFQLALLRNSTEHLMSVWSKSKKTWWNGRYWNLAIKRWLCPAVLPDPDDITESSHFSIRCPFLPFSFSCLLETQGFLSTEQDRVVSWWLIKPTLSQAMASNSANYQTGQIHQQSNVCPEWNGMTDCERTGGDSRNVQDFLQYRMINVIMCNY